MERLKWLMNIEARFLTERLEQYPEGQRPTVGPPVGAKHEGPVPDIPGAIWYTAEQMTADGWVGLYKQSQ
jgi:hypothetical protein